MGPLFQPEFATAGIQIATAITINRLCSRYHCLENAAAQHCLKGNTLIQHLTTQFQSQFDQNVAAAKAQMFQGQGIETTLRAMRSKLSSRPSMAKCT